MSVFLRLPSVKSKTGLGRSTIYSLISRGDFPKPIALGARAVGFLEHEIDAWVSARVEQSRGKKAEVVLPAVQENPDTSVALATESRPVARFGSRGLQMGRRLAIGKRIY